MSGIGVKCEEEKYEFLFKLTYLIRGKRSCVHHIDRNTIIISVYNISIMRDRG